MSQPDEPFRVLTERLDLRAVTRQDLGELYRINSDPRTWAHFPEGRHAHPVTTRNWIDRAVARWEDDGLSYWTARLRATGETVGIGGPQRQPPGYWNLYYRLAPAHWGRGYATELSRAARAAAARHSPELPFIAWIHARNTASRRVAERLGLRDWGPRPEPARGDVMHAYAEHEPVF